jgi:PAS domain-containing protein
MGENSAASNDLVQSTLLGELVEHANVGVLAADSGRYVAANDYACALIGYDRSELLGRPVKDIEFDRGGEHFAFRRKDGGVLEVVYHAAEAKLAGLTIKLCLFWPA